MMDSDLSTFELALLRTERDIAAADDEKMRLETEIVRMRTEIARIGPMAVSPLELRRSAEQLTLKIQERDAEGIRERDRECALRTTPR